MEKSNTENIINEVSQGKKYLYIYVMHIIKMELLPYKLTKQEQKNVENIISILIRIEYRLKQQEDNQRRKNKRKPEA